MPASSQQREAIVQLRRQLPDGALVAAGCGRRVTLGCEALDGLLPAGGVSPGSLVEWLVTGAGTGAEWLAMRGAVRGCPERKVCVFFDRQRELYPNVAAASGQASLEPLVVVRAASDADEFWGIEQALRCPAVGAVWARCERVSAVHIRRWQLAAETSGAVGMLIRPVLARGEPSWANVRLLVEPCPGVAAGRRCRVELLRCRGGGEGGAVELVLDERTGQVRAASHPHETHPLPSISELAAATVAGRAAGTASSAARSASA